ncbi:hypothetical protein HanPI659440_Chr04g0177441 [Helianthus annuus]|nr:hypothetical protein HanPI659440_Chr04g0177441 [Helianthus annuus]
MKMKKKSEDSQLSCQKKKEKYVRRFLSRRMLSGPFKFGDYVPGTAPNRIPYHLYLLVKEAVMKRHDNPIDLATVESKIHFLCNYFHSHLPYQGWKYRDAASTVVTRYRFKRGPKYNMADYIPFSLKDLKVAEYEFDKYTNLSRQEMIKVMSIIHSRKTPTFWKLSLAMISFYCKICSCFGIDYRRLEGASEDDVCLMKSISLEEEEEEEERSKASSSTPNKAQDLKLKDMKILSSNDEVFHLSSTMVFEIMYIARSQRTPITMNWDEYAISFYHKMCACFGVDCKDSEDDCQEKPLLSTSTSMTKEMPLEEQVCSHKSIN